MVYKESFTMTTMDSIKGWGRGGGETVLGPKFPLPVLSNVGSCPILVVHASLPFSNICNNIVTNFSLFLSHWRLRSFPCNVYCIMHPYCTQFVVSLARTHSVRTSRE